MKMMGRGRRAMGGIAASLLILNPAALGHLQTPVLSC